MQQDKSESRGTAWLLVLGIVFLLVGVYLLWAQTPYPDEKQAGVAQVEMVASGSKQAQTIRYARCGHEVVRRIDVPAGWVGMTKNRVEAALTPQWRITAFSPDVIEMTCTEDLFCPEHWVLMLGADGMPGIYQNRYGFEMEHLDDVRMGTLDEDTRQMLTRGLGFENREALEAWVEAWKEKGKDTKGIAVNT